MQVTQYTYQSPYTSPVQFGRVDPNSQKEQEQKEQELPEATNQTASEAQQFAQMQQNPVEPRVTSEQTPAQDSTQNQSTNQLDLYV